VVLVVVAVLLAFLMEVVAVPVVLGREQVLQ
jgi:hypothetical protein